jgi:FkbM family methyltransferase
MLVRLLQRRPRRDQKFNEQATWEDIIAAYRLFLKRAPDPEGLEHYRQLVASGASLDRLISSFVNSDEYRRLIASESEITSVDLGGYFVCVLRSETDFGRGIILTKQYEPHVRGAISSLLSAGQTFVDIGANVGCISFLAAKLVGPSGKVISIEPNRDNAQLLYAGIILNEFDNVQVLPYAASNARAVFALTGGTSNTYLVPPGSDKGSRQYTQSIVLDEELAQLAAIDFVKMDIEGHEPLALQGFSTLIRKHQPILLTEFNPYCLTNIQHIPPIDYLEQVLEYYSSLHVITTFGDSITFTNADELMKYWSKRNAEIVADKILPDGMLHFDIIASNRQLPILQATAFR